MQHINLMQSAAQGRRLKAGHLFVLIAVALVLSVAYSGWLIHQSQVQQQRLAHARTEVRQAQQRLEAFRQANPEVADNADLLAEIETLQTQRTTRLQLLSNLQRSVGLRNVSYYSFMESLAQQRIDGVWLTEFGLDNRPGSARLGVTLVGETEAAELLPRYLDRLRTSRLGTQDLVGFTFNNMELERLTEGTDRAYYRFQLRTEAQEAAEAAPADKTGLSRVLPQAPLLDLDELPLELLRSLQ